ncbi:hypothetical protein NMY22_g18106 [Coprinellus aureogranulatus]|nr:hypothetical protein NMY22_g18106 [Coprinellus aureogranulatus]
MKTAHDCELISPSPELLSNLFGGSTKLMAKRPFYRSETGLLIRHAIAEEVELLTIECNTTYFANALLLLAYDYMDSVEARKAPESPPYKGLRPRFVKTAFCLVFAPHHGSKDSANNMIAALKLNKGAISPSIRHSYMIEEKIEDMFVKYVHNGEPVPFVNPGSPHYDTAELLCFTQHVQYIQTERLAFVSDYQGGKELLTDPQILTSDLGKHTFGSGNIAEGFEDFEKKHQCNRYCQWYELDAFSEDPKVEDDAATVEAQTD